jgi:hypothetical protein
MPRHRGIAYVCLLDLLITVLKMLKAHSGGIPSAVGWNSAGKCRISVGIHAGMAAPGGRSIAVGLAQVVDCGRNPYAVGAALAGRLRTKFVRSHARPAAAARRWTGSRCKLFCTVASAARAGRPPRRRKSSPGWPHGTGKKFPGYHDCRRNSSPVMGVAFHHPLAPAPLRRRTPKLSGQRQVSSGASPAFQTLRLAMARAQGSDLKSDPMPAPSTNASCAPAPFVVSTSAPQS